MSLMQMFMIFSINFKYVSFTSFFFYIYIENCLQVIFETLPINVNCLHPNTLDTMTLCFHNIFLYIYYLSLHIDELHDICNRFRFLPVLAYRHWLIFLNRFTMLIVVLIRSEQDQVHMFISFKTFQIH